MIRMTDTIPSVETEKTDFASSKVPHKSRLSKRIETFCKSWPILSSFACAGLFLDESVLVKAAALYVISVFLFLLGIFTNNVSGWMRFPAYGVLSAMILIGGLSGWARFSPKAPTPPAIETSNFGFNHDATRMIFEFGNTGSDLSTEARIFLGLIPLNGNDIVLDRVSWIPVNRSQTIPLGELETFNFNVAGVAPKVGLDPQNMGVNQIVFFAILILSEQFVNGYSLEIAGFTPDSGRHLALLARNNGNLEAAQVDNVFALAEKVKDCLGEAHDYSTCLIPPEKK